MSAADISCATAPNDSGTEQKQYDRLRQDQFSGDAKPTLQNVTLTARCREKRPMGKLGGCGWDELGMGDVCKLSGGCVVW
jgi:hypothetical protein